MTYQFINENISEEEREFFSILYDKINHIYHEMTSPLLKEHGRIISDFNARGVLNSGGAFTYIGELYENELKARMRQLFSETKDIFYTFNLPLSENLKTEINRFLSEVINTQYQRLKELMKNKAPFKNASDYKYENIVQIIETRFQDTFEREKHYLANECKLWFIAINNKKDDNQKMYQVSINGSNNNVQVGTNNTLINQNFKERILPALDEILSVLNNIDSLSHKEKIELIDIANECKTEIKLENPNEKKIKSFMSELARGINGIAILGGAYQTIKWSLSILGAPSLP